jgi:hypothetical protein
MEGFRTSTKRHKIHRDRRVFGEFPGAGSVPLGREAWVEGMKKQQKTEGRVRSESGLSAIVKVKKPKKRVYAAGIVRVKVVVKGKRKPIVCEIDTGAALWEVCEGLRRITKLTNVGNIVLVSKRLKKEIGKPLDIADGDCIVVGTEKGAVDSENVAGGR